MERNKMAAGTPPGIPDPGGPQGHRDGVVTVTTQDNSRDMRHARHTEHGVVQHAALGLRVHTHTHTHTHVMPPASP